MSNEQQILLDQMIISNANLDLTRDAWELYQIFVNRNGCNDILNNCFLLVRNAAIYEWGFDTSCVIINGSLVVEHFDGRKEIILANEWALKNNKPLIPEEPRKSEV